MSPRRVKERRGKDLQLVNEGLTVRKRAMETLVADKGRLGRDNLAPVLSLK